MRLTLRTLLAYLDNTLDPQDAQSLRDKLGESGFATQLVQRIRQSLADGSLPAPSPEAVGPVEDANVISEYLDSTLAPEQVAEIERACLESAPHLAEAAACHQILTMILGKPAEVSPELRKRIYEFPDRAVEDIPAAGSFSSVSIPTDTPQLPPLTDQLPTADTTSARPGKPVQPVGAADSGVSDAPTRLREAEESEASQQGGAPAIAGSKSRMLETSGGFGWSIRPSRIAPWLVSLALAGVLLFALTRIFQPLLNPRTASLDLNESVEPIGEIEVPPDESPVMVDVESDSEPTEDVEQAGDRPDGEPDAGEESEDLPPPAEKVDAAEPNDADENGEPSTVVAESPEVPTEAPADVPTEAPAEAPTESPSEVPSEAPAEEMADRDAEAADSDQPGPASDADVPSVPPPDAESDVPQPPPADPSAPVPAPAMVELAKITSDETLLAGDVGEKWVRLKKDMTVGPGLTIGCAPTFRGEMTSEGVSITLIGPTEVQWQVDDAQVPTMQVVSGRILLSATKAGATVNVQLGDQPIKFAFTDAGTVAAASVKYVRAPGLDPREPENRIPVRALISVQGAMVLTIDGKAQTIDTHQQWVKRGSDAAVVSVAKPDAVPTWIDPPDPATETLELGARRGLMELLQGEESLEMALREATLDRRTEVSALAAQTLAHLGRGDIYFGGDGILSSPKHRAYWPDHFKTLLRIVDLSPESAQQLFESIERMDSANADSLFRLLTGYSNNQLEKGGDEELVRLLDSPTMAVRVLALENLHRITGTTLYFRAEQELANRRESGIKKWNARLRKGDIRWQL